MSKPVIFTISAAWDPEASVWTGHSDDIPAAADDPTLDGLLAKIEAIALDLLPDNHPGIDPKSLYLQINALREVDLPLPDGPALRPTAARQIARRRLHDGPSRQG